MEKSLEELIKKLEKERKANKERPHEFWRQIYKFSFIGVLIVIPVILFTYLGTFLKKKYALPSWFVVLCIFLGILCACYTLWYAYGGRKK